VLPSTDFAVFHIREQQKTGPWTGAGELLLGLGAGVYWSEIKASKAKEKASAEFLASFPKK
jgi:F0F1-type ATP synthase assembly protein I